MRALLAVSPDYSLHAQLSWLAPGFSGISLFICRSVSVCQPPTEPRTPHGSCSFPLPFFPFPPFFYLIFASISHFLWRISVKLCVSSHFVLTLPLRFTWCRFWTQYFLLLLERPGSPQLLSTFNTWKRVEVMNLSSTTSTGRLDFRIQMNLHWTERNNNNNNGFLLCRAFQRCLK